MHSYGKSCVSSLQFRHIAGLSGDHGRDGGGAKTPTQDVMVLTGNGTATRPKTHPRITVGVQRQSRINRELVDDQDSVHSDGEVGAIKLNLGGVLIAIVQVDGVYRLLHQPGCRVADYSDDADEIAAGFK